MKFNNGCLWWNKKNEWSYNTIEKTSSLKEREASLSDKSILDYDYIITFDNRPVDCCFFRTDHFKVGTWELKSVGGIMVGLTSQNKNNPEYVHYEHGNPFSAPSFTEASITNSEIKKTTKVSTNRMLEVENLTLLEFHYMDEGVEKTAIAVDTYDKSVGGSQFTDNNLNEDNRIINFLKQIGEFICDILSINPIAPIKIVIGAGVLIIAFLLALKIVPTLIGGLINLILGIFK